MLGGVWLGCGTTGKPHHACHGWDKRTPELVLSLMEQDHVWGICDVISTDAMHRCHAPPMHRCHAWRGLPITKSPIRPHPTCTHRDYMILLLAVEFLNSWHLILKQFGNLSCYFPLSIEVINALRTTEFGVISTIQVLSVTELRTKLFNLINLTRRWNLDRKVKI